MTDPLADLDADQLTQVLVNLVSNAYAAMPEGDEMTAFEKVTAWPED